MAPRLMAGVPRLEIAPDSAAAGGTSVEAVVVDPLSAIAAAARAVGGMAGADGDDEQLLQQQQLLAQAAQQKFKDRDFEFLCEVGSGSGGSVAKVRHRATGAIMARKNILIIVDSEADRKKAEKQLKTELRIVHMVRSEYIVQSYGAFSHEGDVSIVMEYMDVGSLDKIYRQAGAIPEPVVTRIAVHVLRGLEYLTAHNIVHRDIKPSNILVNSRGQVKIGDFGVSKETASSVAKTFTGTPSYLAPERIQSGTDYNVVSDVWSLGLSLIEISTARSPYGQLVGGSASPVAAAAAAAAAAGEPQYSMFDLMSVIQEQPAPTLPPGRFSAEFEEFVATCVIKDYKQRPGPDVLLRHPVCMRVVQEGISVADWAQQVLALMPQN
ncbi:Dual specificity mitogen-activated protein kinase kinase dSOR1 [Cladochytrium tenue]|nr:Dual specificity mitogen-activated protein kinase kinase dSOR1 [Cladochytrium tenue]